MTFPGDLALLLAGGESSGVEFKRDDIQPERLARELVALANLRGGRVLLGVEDDGSVIGVTRPDVEAWVMTAARDKVRPPLIPYFEMVVDPLTARSVAVVTVEQGYAVHAVWHNNHFTYLVRVGSQSREASPEELGRLQQQRGSVRGELRPVGSAGVEALDLRRLTDYFGSRRGQDVPAPDDTYGWERLLLATELMVDGADRAVATVAAVALCGLSTRRLLPQSAIDAVAYPGVEADYAATRREALRGPLLPLADPAGGLLERGLVEQAVDFVHAATGATVSFEDGVRRIDHPAVPDDALREVLVNALIHRDYLLTGTDVLLAIFADRIEVTSPGRLPNGVTVEGMRLGVRAARNELLKDVMRDYGYLEHMGLGFPRKVIAGMRAFNGTDPGLEVRDERVRVSLLRGPLRD